MKESRRTAKGQSRRGFLRRTGATVAGVVTGAIGSSFLPAYAHSKPSEVFIVADPDDPVIEQESVKWAIGHLRSSLSGRGVNCRVEGQMPEQGPEQFCIVVGTDRAPLGRKTLNHTPMVIPPKPEALCLTRAKIGRNPVLLAGGSDVRGVVYALLELADRVEFAAEPLAELQRVRSVQQKPANQIRSIARLFTSEIEDKAWFNDRAFWESYLTELATQRFNRFSLTLGLGYDFPSDIRDAYFYFAYPFLVSVPGYAVRATPLPETEREQNLAMLQFISEETARRGLHFQLGLWTHAWQWVNSPKANYIIEGLSAETHAAYCRDALEVLLRSCPAISGVTFRVHGESGVAEGSYDFWKTVFDGVVRCGRRVEIDMHAKGMDEPMINVALATRMPINISPKFWAEHMGLGYMQGAIRPLEMPPREEIEKGFFSKSSGSRRFLRYGYGDLLKENRGYGVLHRIWPGTQRLLLWGSPELAADYGRAASFCGSLGVEWCEPLSFKGRKGSGLAGGREAYADPSLRSSDFDFEKYRYSYRVWGRPIFDPNCDPDEWRRYLRKEFGRGAPAVETSLQAASRILPLITTAHCPSAANNNYWPEMYINMAIVDAKRPHPYGDTLSPKRFGAVSPLDPEFFSRIDDFAEELLKGESNAKYSALWVADSLNSLATASAAALRDARHKVPKASNPGFRRLQADVAIQNGLGLFFCWKFRAALLFAIHERTGSVSALEQALATYRQAQSAWSKMAAEAKRIYRSDVTFGPGDFQRGHWLDRLPAMDADISDMERLLQRVKQAGAGSGAEPGKLARVIAVALQPLPRPKPPIQNRFHVPPVSFRPGASLPIQVSAAAHPGPGKLRSVHLRFRRANQAEIWQRQEMERQGPILGGAIPASYTDSPFPLLYHFECKETSGSAFLFPGLGRGSNGQPYFVVRQS